jgi:hypothetical protein
MSAQLIIGIVAIFAAICSALAAVISSMNLSFLSSLDRRLGVVESHLMKGA